ncbi:MAG: hypothetical protein ABIA75_04310 [Candidatus Neomarinimicrobiota bacterium]
MDFESKLAKLSADPVAVPDSADFIARLHTRQIEQANMRQSRRYGAMAALLLVTVLLIGRFQLNNTLDRLVGLDAAYLTQEERQSYDRFIDDAALYLISESEDVWATVEFFGEIDYKPAIATLEQPL